MMVVDLQRNYVPSLIKDTVSWNKKELINVLSEYNRFYLKEINL